MSSTQAGSIARARGPDSPPAITQSMPSRAIPGRAVISGSHDRNRVAAGTARRWSIRSTASMDSTETPIHRFSGQSSFSAILAVAVGALGEHLIGVLRGLVDHVKDVADEAERGLGVEQVAVALFFADLVRCDDLSHSTSLLLTGPDL